MSISGHHAIESTVTILSHSRINSTGLIHLQNVVEVALDEHDLVQVAAAIRVGEIQINVARVDRPEHRIRKFTDPCKGPLRLIDIMGHRHVTYPLPPVAPTVSRFTGSHDSMMPYLA